MKTAKLIIDGKEIEVQLSDEQVEELTAPEKVTGFERGDRYWYVDPKFDVDSHYDEGDAKSAFFYEAANYYTDIELAEWCNRRDTLNRKMRRWAAEHNIYSFDWSDPETIGWHISYDSRDHSLVLYHSACGHLPEVVYFSTEETAEAAIKEFGDEIKWLAENRPKWF